MHWSIVICLEFWRCSTFRFVKARCSRRLIAGQQKPAALAAQTCGVTVSVTSLSVAAGENIGGIAQPPDQAIDVRLTRKDRKRSPECNFCTGSPRRNDLRDDLCEARCLEKHTETDGPRLRSAAYGRCEDRRQSGCLAIRAGQCRLSRVQRRCIFIALLAGHLLGKCRFPCWRERRP